MIGHRTESAVAHGCESRHTLWLNLKIYEAKVAKAIFEGQLSKDNYYCDKAVTQIC